MFPNDAIPQYASSKDYKIRYRNRDRHTSEVYACKDKLEFFDIIREWPELMTFGEDIDYGRHWVNILEVGTAFRSIDKNNEFALRFKDSKEIVYFGPDCNISYFTLNKIYEVLRNKWNELNHLDDK